jgi:hypothetical protein
VLDVLKDCACGDGVCRFHRFKGNTIDQYRTT